MPACNELGAALLPFIAPHLQHQVRATVGEWIAEWDVVIHVVKTRRRARRRR